MAPFYCVPRIASEEDRRAVAVVFSDDGGETWADYSMIYYEDNSDICPSETDIVILSDGRYLAMSRANARNLLYRSYPSLVSLPSNGVLCVYYTSAEQVSGDLNCDICGIFLEDLTSN